MATGCYCLFRKSIKSVELTVLTGIVGLLLIDVFLFYLFILFYFILYFSFSVGFRKRSFCLAVMYNCVFTMFVFLLLRLANKYSTTGLQYSMPN